MKAAVIGCGRMGAFTSEAVRRFAPDCWFPLAHAEAIAAHPQLELAALCDSDAQRLATACAAYGDPPGFTDVHTLAQQIRPAMAGVATRTIGRAAIIETLHTHGARAFHIEKPLCNSMAELEHLALLLDRADVFATYGAVRRHFDIYAQAVAMAHSGDFGELVEVRSSLGAGALFWTQPHAVDLLLFATKGCAVEGVQARLGPLERGSHLGEIRNDPEVLSATVWFEDGVVGQIGRAPGCDLALSCTRGEIAVRSDGRRLEVAVQHGSDPYLVREDVAVSHPAGALQGTFAPVSQLAACIGGDVGARDANLTVKRDMLLGQRIAFGFVQSHLEGSRVVVLDTIDPGLNVLGYTGGNHA